jgi:hypothetical protein
MTTIKTSVIVTNANNVEVIENKSLKDMALIVAELQKEIEKLKQEIEILKDGNR